DDTFKTMIQYGIEHSNAVTAVSRSLVEQTKEMLDIHKTIHVIYNFVNEQEYNKKHLPAIKQQYGIREDEKLVIHISKFRKVKRTEDIIYRFIRNKDADKAKRLMIGDGKEYSAVYQLADSLGLKDNILFLRKQKNISDLL